jgi:hypothetical protein
MTTEGVAAVRLMGYYLIRRCWDDVRMKPHCYFPSSYGIEITLLFRIPLPFGHSHTQEDCHGVRKRLGSFGKLPEELSGLRCFLPWHKPRLHQRLRIYQLPRDPKGVCSW